MAFRSLNFHRISSCLKCLIRHSNSNVKTSSPNPLLTYETAIKFNKAEQEKVLSTLNQLDKEHLTSLKVSQSKITVLERHQKKRGPFKSFDDILEVDGFSEKLLEKLCKQILEPPKEIAKINKPSNGSKKNKQFLSPPLSPDTIVSSAVGVHVAPMGISWSKLVCSENEVVNWGYEDFANLPKKMLPTDTFKQALNIMNKLPTGDIYVFEGTPSMGLQSQKQPSAVTSYTQQLELSSMLLALINTSAKEKQHSNDKEDISELENKVFFLRSKLPARLFKTLVGNECVSSTNIILQLLEGESKEFSLPCSTITMDQKLKSDYLSKSSPHKELLGQALMLIVAFADLCIKRNPVSLKVIAAKNNNK